MSTFDLRKQVSFKCCACQGRAQVTVDNGRVNGVECVDCKVSVDSDAANLMYETLIKQHIVQEGRNFSRRLIMESGLGRILTCPRSLYHCLC